LVKLFFPEPREFQLQVFFSLSVVLYEAKRTEFNIYDHFNMYNHPTENFNEDQENSTKGRASDTKN
jgi:hypothetical protein